MVGVGRGAALWGLALAVLAVSACGRKTPVRPPELVAPEPISDLSAVNAADGVRLTWRRPDRYVDGARMADLGAFRVERSTAGGSFAPLATVAVTDRDRFQQAHHFTWLDAETAVGETYQYRVISFTTDGYVSQPSNIATVQRAVPTPAPRHTPHATPGG